MPRFFSGAACGVLVLVALASPAAAAPIFLQGFVTAEADVLNTGTLISANHFGVGAAPLTVNGVTFGTSAVGIAGMATGGGDFSTQFPPASPLDQLMSGLLFQTGGTSSLTLSGLTTGEEYRLQLFMANSVNNTGKTSRVTVQGQAHNIANFGNNAAFLRVLFQAASTTEVIQFGTGSGSEPERMVLNGYAVQHTVEAAPVPEPASLTLLGAGLAGAAWRRRRARR